MKKIIFNQMHIYTLFRSIELDHELGRPAVFLDFLGNESLVWVGTTTKRKIKENPIVIFINDIETYFYNKGIIKVNTEDLIGKWHNNKTNKIFVLDDNQQKLLITKFSNLTFQIDPYEEIKILKSQICVLESEIKQIKEKNIYEK